MPATPELWRDLGQNNTSEGTPAIFVGDQNEPKVTHLSNGNILVAWVSNQTTGPGSPNGTDIIGRIYDSLGNAVGGEFRLNATQNADNERDFDIAATSNGGFAMVYVDADDPNNSETDVYVAEYDSSGAQLSNILVASDGTDAQTFRNPNIAINGDTALISYENNAGVDNEVEVESKTYTLSTNTVGSVNTVFNGAAGTGQGVSGSNVATLSNNGFVVVWGNNNDAPTDDIISVQRFNSAGAEVGAVINVSTGLDFNQDPHVIGLSGGGFVVVWETDGTDFSGNSGPRYRVYDNNGVAQTGVTGAATTTAGNQSQVVVGALADGGFVIAWVDESTDDIHARRFDASGAAVGNEFNVDTNIGPLSSNLDIEGLEDGRFIITWTESVATGGVFPFTTYDTDIRSRIYDPRDEANSPNAYDGDQVIGTIGADTIIVADPDDEVYGSFGNDTLSFANNIGHFNDIYDGGSGSDRLLLTEAGTNDFSTASFFSIEEIEFEAGANENKTAIFDASEFGGSRISFNAIIDGNSNGSNAVDTLRINMGSDTNINLSGLQFQSWVDTIDILEINGDDDVETITGSSVSDTINGGRGADTINGGAGNDVINGDGGNDTINGGSGNDDLDGGAGQGDDTINGGIGNDTINGRNGVDVLSGGDDNDTISGQNKNDVLMGDAGNDTLNGNQGNDSLLGGDDNDTLNGGAAADTLNGQDGDDDLFGGGQADILNGGSGMDELDGGSGNDTLSGGGDADILFGGNNNDTLNGNGGADELRGGAGNDRLTGGSDAGDIFVFDISDAGSDTITDYQDNFDSFRFTGGIGLGNITVSDAGASGQNARIDIALTGIVITILNVDHNDIDVNDFMFV